MIICLVATCLMLMTTVFSHDVRLLCNNIENIHRYCIEETTESALLRVGKAGPKGEKGEAGSTTEVDCTRLQQTMNEKFEGKVD